MNSDLKKVIFDLNEQNLSLGDLNNEDKNGILFPRRGYFHRWGDIEKYDLTLGKNIQKTVAIIEEEKTGQIFEVAPHRVKFENWQPKY
ncbi:MAG: hypothetical protein IKQ70_12745 [Bacteroidales bacterium]|nr:hypothetical protein [Bacteroidales bacterium]